MSQFGLPCFVDNLKLFGNLTTGIEKYNLYNGLRTMAEDLIALSQAVHNIEMQIHRLKEKHYLP